MLELESISDMRFKVNGLVGLLKKLTVKKAENFVNISFLPDEVLEKDEEGCTIGRSESRTYTG